MRLPARPAGALRFRGTRLLALLIIGALASAAAGAQDRPGGGVEFPLVFNPMSADRMQQLFVRHEMIKATDIDLEGAGAAAEPGLATKAVALASVATGDVSATLRNLANAQYSLPVAFGTPAQTFYLLVDTGSTDTWLINRNCTNCRANSAKFNPAASTSYAADGRPFQITYGSGAVEGVVGRDTISVAGFAVAGQAFGLAHATSGLGSSISGILGLAFPSIATPAMRPPLFDSLATQYALSAQAFTLSLALSTASSSLRVGGYPDLPYYDLPLLSTDYWAVSMARLTVGSAGANLCPKSSCKAIVDSGTSLFIGPTAVIKTILAALAAAAPASAASASSGATRTWDCSGTDALPTIFVAIRGTGTAAHVLSLAPSQYVIGYGSRSCVYGFDALDSDSFDFILGDVFMRAAVTVFDRSNSRVRLSPVAPSTVSSYDCAPSCSPIIASSSSSSSSASASSSSSSSSSSSISTSPTTWTTEETAAAQASAEEAARFGGIGVSGLVAACAASGAVILVAVAAFFLTRRWLARRSMAASSGAPPPPAVHIGPPPAVQHIAVGPHGSGPLPGHPTRVSPVPSAAFLAPYPAQPAPAATLLPYPAQPVAPLYPLPDAVVGYPAQPSAPLARPQAPPSPSGVVLHVT